LVQELSGGAATVNYLTGLHADEIYSRTDSSSTQSFMTDALGSVFGLSNSSGTVPTTYAYEPYGAATLSGSASGNALQFTGRENDGTGLYYNRFRYYSPRYGRFISEDPRGFAGGTNLYGYTGGNPTNFTDPLGLTGAYPPTPPGFDEGWKAGVFDDGTAYWQDPQGNKWLPHPEDWGHWRHWDKQDKDGNDQGPWPPNSGKMWPLQKKPKSNQCEKDPSGDAPPGPKPEDYLPRMPWLFPEWYWPGLGGARVPLRIPMRIPVP
jgi:RHS repeat-associated protein